MKAVTLDVVFILGCALIVAGVAVVYWPVALILAGVMTVGVALSYGAGR